MNLQFHWAHYLPSDCQRLLGAVERNFNRFSSAARLQVSTLPGKERSRREHWKLLALTQQGRAEGAAARLERHIRDTQRSIRARVR